MGFTRTVRALGATALTGALILAAGPAASADQTRRDQWALPALQADSVWKISKGKGVTVAVIDSGVNAEHVDLRGNVLKGKDFVDGDDDASPTGDPHGTAMASLIAGHGHGAGAADGVMGLAPEAKILPIRDGRGFAEEIRYAVDRGASIINISMSSTLDDPRDREAVAYALKHNVLIISGSGNDGTTDIKSPAIYPGVLTVGGVDKSGTVWENSNYGPEVVLTAPATDIVSASWPSNKLRIASGTSDAAAFTSGAAALLRSKFPELTAGQIANRLVKTATLPESAKGISLPDEKYGYGTIDPLAALTKDIPAGSKYGPLKVPESLSPSDADAPSAGTSDTDKAEQEKADRKQMIFLSVLGVVGLAVIGLVVFVIVKLARRKKNNGGGPGGPGGNPQYGQQLPPQPGPYQQQPPQPQGQWPPRQ